MVLSSMEVIVGHLILFSVIPQKLTAKWVPWCVRVDWTKACAHAIYDFVSSFEAYSGVLFEKQMLTDSLCVHWE